MPLKKSVIDLKRKLRDVDPDTDCVAIFKPGKGVAFHIPDKFSDMVQEGQPIPTYVLAVLLHVHLYKYFDTDPTVKEFADKFREQIYLDLATEGNDYEI